MNLMTTWRMPAAAAHHDAFLCHILQSIAQGASSYIIQLPQVQLDFHDGCDSWDCRISYQKWVSHDRSMRRTVPLPTNLPKKSTEPFMDRVYLPTNLPKKSTIHVCWDWFNLPTWRPTKSTIRCRVNIPNSHWSVMGMTNCWIRPPNKGARKKVPADARWTRTSNPQISDLYIWVIT